MSDARAVGSMCLQTVTGCCVSARLGASCMMPWCHILSMTVGATRPGFKPTRHHATGSVMVMLLVRKSPTNRKAKMLYRTNTAPAFMLRVGDVYADRAGDLWTVTSTVVDEGDVLVSVNGSTEHTRFYANEAVTVVPAWEAALLEDTVVPAWER